MKALVTGHRGFLGRHFAKRLAEYGYSVTGVDLVDPEHPYDALDLFASGTTRFDLVVHCAAVSPHRMAIDNRAIQVGSRNLMLDAALFDWASRTEPGRVVYLSSSAAYPAHLQKRSRVEWLCEFDIDLDHRVIGNPDAVYGWVKLTGEHLAERYRQSGGRATVVRPFSGYGSDQSGEFPFGAFRDRARRKDDPFEIWGSGEQVRDFIHVSDIVEATIAMVTREIDGPLNLCTGVPTSMRQLAQLFCDAVGYQPEFRPIGQAPSGVDYRVGDPTELHDLYIPKTSIQSGVELAIGR